MMPEWIDRAAYPFTPRYFSVPAGCMHYVDEGRGHPLVLLHGNPTWSFLYRKLIAELRTEYRCVAPDHIGFGLSDKPAGWSYRPQDHAINLTALIESLSLQKPTLVLHDWGGPIGLSYACHHPDNVAGIILLNTWAWPVNRNPRFAAFSRIMGGPLGRALIRRFNAFVNMLMPMAFGDRDRLDPAAHEHYRRPLGTPARRTGCLVLPRAITAESAWLEQLANRLGALQGNPVLIVWGMRDIAFGSKELAHWQRLFPQAETVRLEGVGHFVPEEAPGEFARAVRSFLPRVTG